MHEEHFLAESPSTENVLHPHRAQIRSESGTLLRR